MDLIKYVLIKGKKAFLLSLLALIITSFLVFLFSARLHALPDYKVDITEGRINLVNYYLESLFNYAETATSISGYTAMQGVLADMASTDSFNSAFETQFAYCVAYGNLTPAKVCPGMTSRNLNFYLDNVTATGGTDLKLRVSYSLNNVTFFVDQDPFYLGLRVNLTINLSDNFVNISSTRIFESRVSINGLYDPLYLINGTYNQTIKTGNLTSKVSSWNAQDLEQMYRTKEYRYSPLGISFVNRIKGNITTGSRGIESVINHTQPSVASLISADISMIDYLFWNRTILNCGTYQVMTINPPAIPSIPSSPLFQIDERHRLDFNISISDTSPTC